MNKLGLRHFLLIPLCLLIFPQLSLGEDCDVSLPNKLVISGTPRVMSAPGYNSSTHDWYGTENLAALIPKSGKWVGMGAAKDYGDKMWWWSADYNIAEEPRPNLKVTAKQLGSNSVAVAGNPATNGFGDNWQAMLVGFEFPKAGCWKVTGTYKGHEVTFVLKVG